VAEYRVELTDEQAQNILDWRGGNPLAPVHGQLADAIRANPPKPPRMTEPGWQPQVIAHTNDNSRRQGFSAEPWATGGQWVTVTGKRYSWSELIDPEPVDGAS
jgi:hypothetical protein